MNTEDRLTSAAYSLKQAADALMGINPESSADVVNTQCHAAGEQLMAAANALNDDRMVFTKPLV